MTDTLESIDALATRFFAAAQAGDTDTVAGIYCDETVVWKNFEQISHSAQSSVDFLKSISQLFRDVQYLNVRRHVYEGGFVQLHNYVGTNNYDDKPFDIPCCVVAAVKDGHITRIDEYLDSAHRAKRPPAA